MIRLNVNGTVREVDAEPDTPLLWALREQVGLTGTKYGCGVAQCGACTVHIDGQAVRSCAMPVSAITAEQKIVTIEGLSADGTHPVQKAWAALDVPQCGYLPGGYDHVLGSAAPGAEPEADRGRHPVRDHQHLPLRHLQSRPRRHQACRRGRRSSVAAEGGEHGTHDGFPLHLPGQSFAPLASSARRDRQRPAVFTLRVPDRATSRPRRPLLTQPPPSPPEVNAWVVIRPDDTVVIRIARSEMGQGTLTGLAQLVAEELECDWTKVTTEYPTPGQSLARKPRVGRFLDRRQPRHPRIGRNYVRKGGATARTHADPGGRQCLERAGLGVPGGRRASSPTPASGRTVTFGKVAAAAGKRSRSPTDPSPEGARVHLEASIGKPLKRLDTAREADRQAQVYGIDMEASRPAERRHQGLPGLRRQGGELRRQGRSLAMPGVKQGGPGRRQRGRGRGRYLVARQHRARGAVKITWDEGPNAKVTSSVDRGRPQGGARRQGSLSSATSSRRRRGRALRRASSQDDRGGLRRARSRTMPPWSP